MRLKIHKSWEIDGSIVLEVKDHDAMVIRKTNYWRDGAMQEKTMLHVATVTKMVLPRGTSKEVQRTVRKNLLLAVEVQQEK